LAVVRLSRHNATPEFPAHGRRVKSRHLLEPAVDELLDRARTVNDSQRRTAYEGVWQQVSKDLPIIYLWTPRNIVGLSSKIAGFTYLADGLLRLQDVHPRQ
jgi:peptide/nickel transport system substrate-binding protein